MKKQTFDVEQILKVFNNEGYCVLAIRYCADDENYKVGDICRNSFDWDYDNDCSTYYTSEPVEFDGTCGFEVEDFCFDDEQLDEAKEVFQKALNKSNRLYSGKCIVIAGDHYSYGYDENEVIIRDAVVIAM